VDDSIERQKLSIIFLYIKSQNFRERDPRNPSETNTENNKINRSLEQLVERLFEKL